MSKLLAGGRRNQAQRGRRAPGRDVGGEWNQTDLGVLYFRGFVAKRANLAEAAFFAIDPLKQEDEQEITPQGAECQEDSERRHGVMAASGNRVGAAAEESTEEVVGKV